LRIASNWAILSASNSLSPLISLISVPLIIKLHGIDYWASIAYNQSIGTIFSVIAGLGWNLSLPATLYSYAGRSRMRIIFLSFISRFVFFSLLMTFGTVFCFSFLKNDSAQIMALLASGSLALNSVWYFVAISKPSLIFRFDFFPRALLGLTGLCLALITSEVVYIFMGILLGSILSFITILKYVWKYEFINSLDSFFSSPRLILSVFLTQGKFVVTSLSILIYTQVPILLSPFLLNSSSSTFILGMKVIQIATFGFYPANQIIMMKINAKMASNSIKSRTIIQLIITCLTYSTIFFLFFDYIVSFLTSTADTFDSLEKAVLCLTVFSCCASQFTGWIVLPRYSNSQTMLKGAAIAIFLGLPVFVLFSFKLQLSGAIIAYLLIESAVLIVHIRACRRFLVLP